MGWIEYGDGEEMAAVLGHLDIVPLGEGWKYPPLGCEIHDGQMYGRGVLDDKGPVIGAIYALKAIRDLDLKIDRRIRVISEPTRRMVLPVYVITMRQAERNRRLDLHRTDSSLSSFVRKDSLSGK